MRKRLLALAAGFAAVVAGLFVAPGVAHAGPPPPWNCAVNVYGTEGARAVCTNGYGWQRATILCLKDNYPSVTQWFYGSWTEVGINSYVFCGAGYGAPTQRGYQTQGVD